MHVFRPFTNKTGPVQSHSSPHSVSREQKLNEDEEKLNEDEEELSEDEEELHGDEEEQRLGETLGSFLLLR